MEINGKIFEGHTYVMGILNATPDSFSDGGKFYSHDDAVRHGVQMVKDGADVIDIGGESTRPGYTKISDEEEIERIVPVIERLVREVDVPISVDTYKSAVADAALAAGASLVNDIWGFKYDDKIAAVTAKHNAACCLMHNSTTGEYTHFTEDVLASLKESIALAKAAGIPDSRIMTDPGVGFAKTYEQNLAAIRDMEQLNTLGFPYLLGVSRKSVIGLTFNTPSDDRLEGTLALTALAAVKNALFVRVHDVKENKRVIQMLEAVRDVHI